MYDTSSFKVTYPIANENARSIVKLLGLAISNDLVLCNVYCQHALVRIFSRGNDNTSCALRKINATTVYVS